MGTWMFPATLKQLNELGDLLRAGPIPASKVVELTQHYVGDDQMYDDFDDLCEIDNGNADARFAIVSFLKRYAEPVLDGYRRSREIPSAVAASLEMENAALNGAAVEEGLYAAAQALHNEIAALLQADIATQPYATLMTYHSGTIH